MKYGYVRVSTREQNVDRQLTAMKKENLEMEQIYVDKASGKDFNRKKYQLLIKKLKEGDELYIKSIDRLGRNYDEILEEWNKITKEKKADIIVLDFPLLDTRERIENLTGKFLADIVLQVLSYVAQIERENTHQRQMEGIKEAKKKGVKFGRPKQKLPDNFYKIVTLWQNDKISLREGAKRLKISHSTFSRKLKEYSITKTDNLNE
ncbi:MULTISPECIES: recombinase family protein [Terrabacteria group]|uniref:recombinase family protein n=1 Tax=Bacillati TaxID=1783272 RepID=UPI001C6ED6B3|nr:MULTISPECIES: recombinase family protein [Terrabacteria group]MBW9212812.1 recombinase family protein [Trueperella sp. zg.1013]